MSGRNFNMLFKLKRYDFAIVHRNFWPKSDIIGEALLQLAEKSQKNGKKVAVITQSYSNLHQTLEEKNRGNNILFKVSKLRSDSSTKLIYRIIDMIIFTLWTFFNLLLIRPKNIYISTDPPLLIPFIVCLYSKLFKCSYTYHLQDIHPEITNTITKINPLLFNLLKKIDNFVVCNASNVITITKIMKQEIFQRLEHEIKIYLIDNPTTAIIKAEKSISQKINGFVFSGNAGRLQQIPLLLKSIEKYKNQGGKLPFIFIGGGIYSDDIKLLARKYEDVEFKGKMSSIEANSLTIQYTWALLPIEDAVTKYAFPCKTSSYLSCRMNILSICSQDTSVAQWVLKNNFGINAQPNTQELVKTFFKIEDGITINKPNMNSYDFSIETYVEKIFHIIYENNENYYEKNI